MLKPGDKAPDFTLYNTNREAVSLSSLQGRKVVLLFFPFAFTGTCTKELCSVRDDIANYSGIGAEVFGISTDSPHTLKKYKEDQDLNFQLLSDYNKQVSPAYFSMYPTFSAMELNGVSKRSAFAIDENGIIQYAEVLENAGEIPDLDAVKKAIS